MRSLSEAPSIVSTENRGSRLPHREIDFPRPFARATRGLWPLKTAAQLAVFAHSTERAAKNWLSGEQDPPAIVVAKVMAEITSDFK
jgi:hypothetical protein